MAEARALLARLKDYEDASSSILKSMAMKQPPAGLIVLVWADVERLVTAAATTQ